MSAPVMPPRKCLIPLLHVQINKGKLHCTARHCREPTCLFAVEFSSFDFGPAVFALVIGNELQPKRLRNTLLPLTTQCLQVA